MGIILTAETLLQTHESYVFIDVRTKTGQFEIGEEAYRDSHIPGAIFLNLKNDLSGKDSFLPEVTNLVEKLGKLGVNEHTKIVLYDQGNQRAASKAWYVFYYLGHQHVYILQGGFPAWMNANGPVTNEIPQRTPTNYHPNIRQEIATSIDEIKENLQSKTATLIDSRAPERYEGQKEPKYHKAGHIPGAVNYHAKNVFTTSGSWKSKEELGENFSGLNQDEKLIVSCGSGNSACMNMVALKEAGYEDVALYAGGFSEWISDDNNQVATEKDSMNNEK